MRFKRLKNSVKADLDALTFSFELGDEYTLLEIELQDVRAVEIEDQGSPEVSGLRISWSL